MSNVYQFSRKPQQPQEAPHLTGEAYCNGCGRRWTAVAPVGSPEHSGPWGELECPHCHAMKGVFTRHCIYTAEGLQHWHCMICKGLLFSIVKRQDGVPVVCCANCGHVAELEDALPL